MFIYYSIQISLYNKYSYICTVLHLPQHANIITIHRHPSPAQHNVPQPLDPPLTSVIFV